MLEDSKIVKMIKDILDGFMDVIIDKVESTETEVDDMILERLMLVAKFIKNKIRRKIL